MKPSRGYYDVFLKTCAQYPSKIAIRHYDRGNYKYYTYSELYGVCEYITQNLQQLQCKKGVIGLVSERNIIVPCLIAAAHKCCSTFMFIDPCQNVEDIAKDVEFTIVITIKNLAANEDPDLFSKKPIKTISVFDLTLSFYICDQSSFTTIRHTPSHSFIAMTSGSTGQPKHIQVPIQCIQPNIDDLTKLFNITPEDVIFFSTPLTFDPSMVEILLACMNGASLLIAPDKPEILFPENGENSITFWQTTPSKFQQFSNSEIRNKVLCGNSTLKILALGGEPLNYTKRLRELRNDQNKTKIFVLYGVTEMSCWASVMELDLSKSGDDREIPLGNCLSETEMIIDNVKKENKTLGKIVLASKTRKCFILNKVEGKNEENCLQFVDTGDIGEIRNGTVYYRGRRDDFIKRFGHKVNLHYIETTVMQVPKVKTCACVWLPKPLLLVLYFSSTETLTSQELTNYLKCKLDDKHWPDNIVHVDNLPTNSHGKISRQMLFKMYEKTTGVPQTFDSLKTMFINELKVILNKYFLYDQMKSKTFNSIGGTSFMAVTMCNKISLTHPTFGKLILPYLVSEQYSIDDIMKIAQREIFREPKSKRRIIKRSVTDSESTLEPQQLCTINNLQRNKKANINLSSDSRFMILWSHDTGKCVDATPTLFQIKFNLYVTVGSHSGKIIVLDARSGELQGTLTLHSRIEAPVLCCCDCDSSPAYGVVGTYDGTIVCFSLLTVKEVWKVNIGSMIKSKGVYRLGQLYIASYDGKVRHMDIKTGVVLQVIDVCENGISADLVLAKNEYILLGSLSGMCACIHTDTKLVTWRSSLSSPVFASPVLYNEHKFVIFAEVTGDISCRSVGKGIKIWHFQGAKGNIFSSLYVKKIDRIKWQMVFGCHDKSVYSVYIKNCLPVLHWKTQFTAAVYATPCALHEDNIVAASSDGKLCVLDSENGDILSALQLPKDTFSSPAVCGDYILIGCRDDRLYSIKYVLS